jgi:hypothetical protein
MHSNSKETCDAQQLGPHDTPCCELQLQPEVSAALLLSRLGAAAACKMLYMAANPKSCLQEFHLLD